MVVYDIDFFAEYSFRFRPRVFSRAFGCGTRRGPACTPRRKCESRADCVACAAGVQSREMWQVIAGLLSDELEPTRPMQTPTVSFCSFFHPYLLLFFKNHSNHRMLGSHGTTTALQAFPFVTATNSASACVRERACVCVCHCKLLTLWQP